VAHTRNMVKLFENLELGCDFEWKEDW
jgi:hypothetical protein